MPGREAQAGWLTEQVPGAPDGTVGHAAVGPGPSALMPSASYEVYGGQRLARLILLTVLVAFLAVEAISIFQSPAPDHGRVVAVGSAAICLLFVLQVFNSSPAAAGWPMRRRVLMLLAQALVTYLPLLVLGSEWAGMAGWLSGSMLLLIPGWTAWALFTAVILSMLVGPIVDGMTALNVAYFTVASLDTGLVVFGLSRLSLIIRYLNATRAEIAQLAVVRERVRIARDLHDLLGYSLSAITLKAELTRRLVGTNPERARDELAELLDVSRQALADVRTVASGYRNMSLSKEAASVTSLLATAGITAEVDIDCGPLAEKVDTVLATVLREAVTNMLRHSTAQACTVTATAAGGLVRLRIVNDGVPAAAASGRDGGGLENLSSRLAAVGGTLAASASADGQFEVLATVPVSAEPAGVPGPARPSDEECEEVTPASGSPVP
jgi:two-component system sensor histidine kinase DesK